jgi:hypothetical protein
LREVADAGRRDDSEDEERAVNGLVAVIEILRASPVEYQS